MTNTGPTGWRVTDGWGHQSWTHRADVRKHVSLTRDRNWDNRWEVRYSIVPVATRHERDNRNTEVYFEGFGTKAVAMEFVRRVKARWAKTPYGGTPLAVSRAG